MIFQVVVATALLASSAVHAPVLRQEWVEPEPTIETRSGPLTFGQLRDELAAAGYSGPWEIASMQTAYANAAPVGVPPYPSNTSWSCLPANPSCGRDPWWLERNEVQNPALVTYQAIGPSFGSEGSFVRSTCSGNRLMGKSFCGNPMDRV